MSKHLTRRERRRRKFFGDMSPRLIRKFKTQSKMQTSRGTAFARETARIILLAVAGKPVSLSYSQAQSLFMRHVIRHSISKVITTLLRGVRVTGEAFKGGVVSMEKAREALKTLDYTPGWDAPGPGIPQRLMRRGSGHSATAAAMLQAQVAAVYGPKIQTDDIG